MSARDTREYLELEDAFAAHNYAPLDVVLTRGEGAWVWDVEGRAYLDFLAAYGAVNQGHNHPRIVAALVEQAGRLALTSRAFRNDRFGPLCEKLCRLLGYERALLMNTGAEAVETAIKAARRWGYDVKGVPEGEARILVFDDNFHGRTTTIVGFSSSPGSRRGFGPFAPGFDRVPFGDLEAAAAAMTPSTVAVLVEPIQGEAGVILPPEGFLRGLRALCDARRALLFCDEIQSGLGRVGHLLAHRGEGIRADGVCVGKALSGGLYPVSAFLADDAVMKVFDPGSHGSTYGGNPLACAVAEAALDVIVDEGLCARSLRLGEQLAAGLASIRTDAIAEVRSRGLWAGVELRPEAGGARRYAEALQRAGLLLKETHTHTLRLAPPLVLAEDELARALDLFRGVLEAG